MPLKKRHTTRNTIIIWALILIIVILMVISFAPETHMTEVVLFQ